MITAINTTSPFSNWYYWRGAELACVYWGWSSGCRSRCRPVGSSSSLEVRPSPKLVLEDVFATVLAPLHNDEFAVVHIAKIFKVLN